jgi:predicted ATPase
MGQDPGVACRIYAAATLWSLGFPAQALDRVDEALALARELSHPFSLAFARRLAAFSQCRRDVAAVHAHAEATVARSTKQGFTQWAVQGTMLRGWALTLQGQGEEEIAQVRQGIASFRATGAAVFVPYFYTWLADVAAHLGRGGEGLQALAEAHTLAEQHEERWWEAEIARLRGVLLLRQPGAPPHADARALLAPIYGWFTEGFDTADLQEAKALLAALS